MEPPPSLTQNLCRIILVVLCFLASTIAQTYSVQTIYHGQPGLWLENLRVRSNGAILTTRLDEPQLLKFNPHSDQDPYLIHEFPGYEGLTGITETLPDVFAVISGNFSLKTLVSEPGSWSVWTVDFRPESCDEYDHPKISKLMDVPESGLLNGITYQPSSNALFIADSQVGVIFKMDASTGQYSVAVNDSLTNKINPSVLEGANGIKYKSSDSSLYWSNSNGGFIAKKALDTDGSPIGESTIVSNPDVNIDDFAFAPDGTAYLAGGFVNQIFRLRSDGEFESIIGNLNSSEVAEPTAVTFGRANGTFYVTTGGAAGDPINGTTVVGGQLLVVEILDT